MILFLCLGFVHKCKTLFLCLGSAFLELYLVPVLVLVLVLTSTRPPASKELADKIKYLVKEQKT